MKPRLRTIAGVKNWVDTDWRERTTALRNCGNRDFMFLFKVSKFMRIINSDLGATDDEVSKAYFKIFCHMSIDYQKNRGELDRRHRNRDSRHKFMNTFQEC